MYAAVLQKEGIDDIDTVLSFNEAELVAYGIKLGHARKLLSVCKDLKPALKDFKNQSSTFGIGTIPNEAPPAYEPVAPDAGPAVSSNDGGDMLTAIVGAGPQEYFGFDL